MAGGVAVFDFNNDGYLDIFVTNDRVYNSFFHNKGDGTFEETAFGVGVALAEDGHFISGMGVDARDVDNDGYPDIAVAALDNETFPIFRNLGKGKFADVTGSSGMAVLSAPMAGYSPNLGDFDNDGWTDLFVSRGHVQSLGYSLQAPVEQPNTVFHNRGAGSSRRLRNKPVSARSGRRATAARLSATSMATAAWM